jgi:ankyrin repeat protein
MENAKAIPDVIEKIYASTLTGSGLLFYAINNNKNHYLPLAFDKGTAFNEHDKESALLGAAIKNNTFAIKFMIERGFDPSVLNNHIYLYAICSANSFDAIDLLLENGIELKKIVGIHFMYYLEYKLDNLL